MKRIKDLMKEELIRRLEDFDSDLDNKKVLLKEARKDLNELKKQIECSNIYCVEKDVNGMKLSVHKKGNKVMAFSGDGSNVTNLLSGILSDFVSLSEKNFVVEGALAKGIFYPYDLLFFGEKDLTSSPWHERKKLLKKLSYSDKIKEIPYVIVENKKDLEASIDLFKKIGSVGVNIRKYYSKYCKGLKSDSLFYLSFG